jgi:hypothetical protein
MLIGHSGTIWPSSPSSRQAQEIRQSAIIADHEGDPIPFSPVLFVRTLRRYLVQLVL